MENYPNCTCRKCALENEGYMHETSLIQWTRANPVL